MLLGLPKPFKRTDSILGLASYSCVGEWAMKRTLLGSFGALALLVSVSSPARADALLELQNGATDLICNNSTAAGVTACLAAGFTTSLNGSTVSFNGGTVGGYSVSN